MKRFVTLVIIICFFLTVIPAFTDSGNAYGKTFFQKLSDSITKLGKVNPESRQTAWTSIFRKAEKNISTWDTGSTEAKPLSLRGNKAELMRRRGL